MKSLNESADPRIGLFQPLNQSLMCLAVRAMRGKRITDPSCSTRDLTGKNVSLSNKWGLKTTNSRWALKPRLSVIHIFTATIGPKAVFAEQRKLIRATLIFLGWAAAASGILHGQGCLNPSASGAQFQASLLPPQTRAFTFETDVTPRASGSSMDGGVSLGLGQLGNFSDMAVTVRWNSFGTIDMRAGAGYHADNMISYVANRQVHIVMNIDLAAKTYSAYVRNLDGLLTAIGLNYSFRTEQQNINSLDRWAAFADIGALQACNGVAYSSLTPAQMLQFDGVRTYVEFPDSAALSIATTGALTVSALINPSTLLFPKTEGSGYVHLLGKGLHGQEEWLFRIYSQGNTENRGNRIGFYIFNLAGGEGAGSEFQDPITPGQWIHVVAVANGQSTYIYKNGVLRRCDQYTSSATDSCTPPFVIVSPQHGTAPFRIGSTTLESFFQGSIRDVRIWNRALSASEVSALYNGTVSRSGLVAEYLLEADVAPNTTGGANGTIFGPVWMIP